MSSSNPSHHIVVTVKILNGQSIEYKRYSVTVANSYELQTYLDDLDFRFDCILEKKVTLLNSGAN